ncbi:HlyD family secretion protein [Aquisediminimonas profunda]|uniref:HlyD family secretion protein n=1 Tax=Aquisediminimonas profunda TaxID=1550733 RepID=UPI001C638C3B|nr:HlyD family secretion protein [Aquisediminimonas profunda]
MNEETPAAKSSDVLTEDPNTPSGWAPPTRSKQAKLAIAAVAILAILLVLYAWGFPPFSGSVQSTDNAYVRGKVTVISPQVSGYVTNVPVQDFQQVNAGQVIAKIDDRIYRARVAQAQANLAAQLAGLSNSAQAERARGAALGGQEAGIANAEAQLARARADMRRADALVADGSISTRERDQTLAAERQAEAALRQARAARDVGREDVLSVRVGRGGLEAGVEAAKAQLRLAQIDLDNTIIRAPADGQLSELGVRIGAFVTAGTQLTYLVPHDKWVVANFKEAQTHDMRIGQPVKFRVDALGGAELRGHVQNLSPAAGSEFAVLKPDNATGNFVKVSQRIAVRISIDPGQSLVARLRPGMSVEARVSTEQK